MPITRAVLILGLAVVFVPGVSRAADHATGVVTSGATSLKVVDAFAFEAVGQFGDPVVRVRLSGRPLDRKSLDTAIDIAFELDAQRRKAGSLDLFVDKATGAYAGATYDLGAGASCGFCMEPAVSEGSKLRIEAGRVRGTVKVAAGSYNSGKGIGLDVALDVPIAVLGGITPLQNAAASAEAAALRTCRALVAKKDDAAMTTCFTPDNPAMRSVEGGDTSAFWTMLTAYDPVFEMTDVTVTGGRTRGPWVELSVEGSVGGSSSKGVAYLLRTPAGARYSHSVVE